MTAGWLVGEVVDRNALRCLSDRGPGCLVYRGPVLVCSVVNVVVCLLPLHGGVTEHALVGALGCFLRLEQRRRDVPRVLIVPSALIFRLS